MPASSRSLARMLAARFAGVLPAPLRIVASGHRISIYADEGFLGGSDCAEIIDEEDGRTIAELVEVAVSGVLGDIQDVVMEYLRTEWPTSDEGSLAMPGVRMEPGRVSFWYGASESDPVVAIGTIELEDLEESGRAG